MASCCSRGTFNRANAVLSSSVSTALDTADPKIESVYNSYAASLADRGFITYAPQNPYIGGDAFRVIQRKANPIKWSLFSLIIRQHERTLDWLAENRSSMRNG